MNYADCQNEGDDYSDVSPYFDAAFYLTFNQDLREAGIDPFYHFMTHGWREGRDPNSWFSTSQYMRKNPDVVELKLNPLLHYVRFGRHEGREVSASVQFSVDMLSPDVIRGWVWRPSTPAEPVEIEILTSDEVVASIRADLYRSDLAEVGKGEGYCGFSIATPRALKDGRVHDVSLRIKGEAEPFYRDAPPCFASAKLDLDQFTLAEVSGSAWIPDLLELPVSIEVHANDYKIFDGKTDRYHRFVWALDFEKEDDLSWTLSGLFRLEKQLNSI
jgi:hypothetical protein